MKKKTKGNVQNVVAQKNVVAFTNKESPLQWSPTAWVAVIMFDWMLKTCADSRQPLRPRPPNLTSFAWDNVNIACQLALVKSLDSHANTKKNSILFIWSWSHHGSNMELHRHSGCFPLQPQDSHGKKRKRQCEHIAAIALTSCKSSFTEAILLRVKHNAWMCQQGETSRLYTTPFQWAKAWANISEHNFMLVRSRISLKCSYSQ